MITSQLSESTSLEKGDARFESSSVAAKNTHSGSGACVRAGELLHQYSKTCYSVWRDHWASPVSEAGGVLASTEWAVGAAATADFASLSAYTLLEMSLWPETQYTRVE